MSNIIMQLLAGQQCKLKVQTCSNYKFNIITPFQSVFDIIFLKSIRPTMIYEWMLYSIGADEI